MNINFNLLLNEDGTNSPIQKEIENAKNKLDPIRIELENKIANLLTQKKNSMELFFF